MSESTATDITLQPWEGSTRTVATVLVATDGTVQADGALRVALARTAELGAHLSALTVATVEPIASPDMPFSLWAEGNAFRRASLQHAVDAQLARVAGDSTHEVTLVDGNPAFTIARVALEQHAALIVVGLGRHEVLDRMFSDETALQLARISRVPVLAVPASARSAPRYAVVAVDFSDISNSAAQAAIEAVGDDGQVDLVHIMPYILENAFSIEAKQPYQRWVEGQLATLAAQLVVPDGVTLNTVAIRGRPAPELLAYAAKVGADLIATGTHGRGFVSRSLIGSVTSQLIRAATCSVLTVPRDPLPALAAMQRSSPAVTGVGRARNWSATLASFTSRNLGRRTILEVNDLEIGAQAQEYNYPLIAAMFDPRDQRLQLMLGDLTVQGRHLSRSISAVTSIDVLTDVRGSDVALRIEHGNSQTLLTFAP